MDINNNQQINTFLKGMNTDVSDALIDSSQYRYAENLRLVTNKDSNTGELRRVEGTQKVSQLGTILAFTQIRDILVAIFVDNGGISIKKSFDKGSTWEYVVKKLPYDEFVYDGVEPHFSLVARYESEDNIKLYIADGIHAVICINLDRDYVGQLQNNTIKDISAYQYTSLQSPHVEIIDGGQLKSAKVQYAYRLYNVGEPATTISPLSNVCSIYKIYGEGYPSEAVTSKAAKITIPQVDGSFERIQVYRINYVVNGQAPTIHIVYDDVLTEYVIDRGASIEQVGDAEFISTNTLGVIPKVIESKEDYLFAANLKYKQDLFDKELEERLGKNAFRAYASGDWDNPSDIGNYSVARKYNKQFDQEITQDISQWNYQYWDMYSGCIGYGGTGPIVKYKLIYKPLLVTIDNEVYDGNRNTYTSDRIDTAVPSLRRGETYRYGIVLYKYDGTRSSVNWIADIMIPDKYISEYDNVSFVPFVSEFGGNNDTAPQLTNLNGVDGWQFNQFGIKFVVDLSNYTDLISGYEIVRCKRNFQDSRIISQGIIGVTERGYNIDDPAAENATYSNTDVIYPTGFMTVADTSGNKSAITDANYIMFTSPEYTYQPDDIQDIIKQYKYSLQVKDLNSYSVNTSVIENFEYTISGSVRYTKGLRFSDVLNLSNEYSRWMGTEDSYGLIDRRTGLGTLFIPANPRENIPGYLDSRNNEIHETSVTHIVPQIITEGTSDVRSIKSFCFPEVPSPFDFFHTNKQAVFKDAITPVGGANFCGWNAQLLSSQMRTNNMSDSSTYDIYANENDRPGASYLDAMGTTGKCVVFELDSAHTVLNYSFDNNVAPVTVANLIKNANPYGGPQSWEHNSPDYYSYGDYVKNTGTTDINVFDGDCYPGIFVYHSQHAFDNSVLINANKGTVIYYVPIESDIDLTATHGDLYTRKKNTAKSYYVQDTPITIDGYVQEKPAYLYNTAYNQQPDILSFSTANYTRIDDGKFDYRVHHSDLKTNNERIDNWAVFKAVNFIDVDTRYGEITNMRLFKDKLLYWQKDATGVLSVNERSIVNDVDTNAIVLGTGGVLSRFDYITTAYGMKPNQYQAETQSNSTQYWWDETRKEIVGYANGEGLVPMAKVKNISNYMNSNTPNAKPSLSYDTKYNELLSSVVNNETVVYNEQIQAFTSIYKFTPLFRANVDDTLILTDVNNVYHFDTDNNKLFNNSILPLVQYVVNKQNTYVKTFDITTFGGRFYGGDNMNNITFIFDTPLKQHSTGTGSDLITNREYDFRLAIPRNNNSSYGDRMRGKTMQCELKSSSNSNDFSLQYIITKFRMSWS